MAVLMAIATTVVVTILIVVVVFLCVAIGFAVTGGNLNINSSRFDAAIVGMVFGVGGVAIVLSLLAGFASMVVAVFFTAMIARALGYWTQQFNVPAWRGQDMSLIHISPPLRAKGQYHFAQISETLYP